MARRRRPTNRPREGLTLVEMFVAVSLFSVLVVAVGWLMLSGTRAQVGWEEGVAPFQQLQRATSRLAEDWSSAEPFFGHRVLVEADRVEFCRLGPGPVADEVPTPTWQRVVYRLDPEDGMVSLRREAYAWVTDEPLWDEVLLVLSEAGFAVGLNDPETEELVWAAPWEDTGDEALVPRLLRLDYTLPRSGEQAAVSLSRVFRHPAGTRVLAEGP